MDSPAYWPRYNGAIEKHIGELKRLFPHPLPKTCPTAPAAAQLLMESILREANARPHAALAGDSPRDRFYGGAHLDVDRI